MSAKIGRHGCGLVAAVALATTLSAPASAAEWQHTLMLYGIGASIDGTAGIGDHRAEVDVGFDEILENLEMAGMLAYRAERGRWAIGADVIYMDLGHEAEGLGPDAGSQATVGLEQLIFELDGSYAITERLDGVAGLRSWEVDADVAIVGGGPLGTNLELEGQESWADPVVGMRYTLPLGAKWSLVGRGDVGGFGVGSDFTWHVTVYADWKLSQHASLALGYRHLDVDYDSGSGAERFVMDVAEGGPAAGFAWSF